MLQSVWKVQHPLLRVALVLAVNVISVSVMQALVEYGDNGRYFIPNQPLVLMCVLLVLADRFARARFMRH